MKVLTVNMLPSSGQIEPLIYRDVKKWDWNENFFHILLEDDDAVICLNANNVLGPLSYESCLLLAYSLLKALTNVVEEPNSC